LGPYTKHDETFAIIFDYSQHLESSSELNIKASERLAVSRFLTIFSIPSR